RHRHPPGDDLHGRFRKALALGNGEAQRLALVVWPGDRGRASADMEVEHFLESRKIEAIVILERCDRALHHTAKLVLHASGPKKSAPWSHRAGMNTMAATPPSRRSSVAPPRLRRPPKRRTLGVNVRTRRTVSKGRIKAVSKKETEEETMRTKPGHIFALLLVALLATAATTAYDQAL